MSEPLAWVWCTGIVTIGAVVLGLGALLLQRSEVQRDAEREKRRAIELLAEATRQAGIRGER